MDNPGAGLLSTGLLQVGNRPFAVSEWTSVFPNEWLAESPAIYAVYGMGLQGWDASYEFASHVYGNRLFANRVCDPRMWVVDLPNQIGLYPALARMIYRGDVREGPVISTAPREHRGAAQGKPEWVGREQIKQSWDFKEYGGTVSAAALAAGRVTVEFVDAPAASVFPDMSKYVREDAVRSAAGQLVWYGAQQGRRGYFQVDTDGTKALVGFPPKSPVALGKVTFSCETPFACLFLTARDRDATLATRDPPSWSPWLECGTPA